jgi:hypothetical protein
VGKDNKNEREVEIDVGMMHLHGLAADNSLNYTLEGIIYMYLFTYMHLHVHLCRERKGKCGHVLLMFVSSFLFYEIWACISMAFASLHFYVI